MANGFDDSLGGIAAGVGGDFSETDSNTDVSQFPEWGTPWDDDATTPASVITTLEDPLFQQEEAYAEFEDGADGGGWIIEGGFDGPQTDAGLGGGFDGPSGNGSVQPFPAPGSRDQRRAVTQNMIPGGRGEAMPRGSPHLPPMGVAAHAVPQAQARMPAFLDSSLSMVGAGAPRGGMLATVGGMARVREQRKGYRVGHEQMGTMDRYSAAKRDYLRRYADQISFDPSDYRPGPLTSALVVLGGLLHPTDPMDAQGALSYADAPGAPSQLSGWALRGWIRDHLGTASTMLGPYKAASMTNEEIATLLDGNPNASFDLQLNVSKPWAQLGTSADTVVVGWYPSGDAVSQGEDIAYGTSKVFRNIQPHPGEALVVAASDASTAIGMQPLARGSAPTAGPGAAGSGTTGMQGSLQQAVTDATRKGLEEAMDEAGKSASVWAAVVAIVLVAGMVYLYFKARIPKGGA